MNEQRVQKLGDLLLVREIQGAVVRNPIYWLVMQYLEFR